MQAAANLKHLIVYVRPAQLEAALAAIAPLAPAAISYSEARGYGRQKAHLDQYRAGEEMLSFLPKIRVMIDLDAASLDAAIEAVMGACRTGSMGDGKILVMDATVR